MSMIEIHRSALEEIIIPYNEFLRAQDFSKKQIFGFVEGKDDPSFYQGHIENCICLDGWIVKLIEAGNKKGNKERVLRLLNVIDWNRYSKKQVLFFVDRDLSEFLNEQIPVSENLYLTDMYSIENYVVSISTLRRVLRELYNVMLQEYEFEIIAGLFQKGLNSLRELMTIITSWYIYLYRNGKKPIFDDIIMDDLVNIDHCQFIMKQIDVNKYLEIKWGFEMKGIDISSVVKEFNEKNGPILYIRGKNLMWFFINFINSFCRNCVEIIPSINVPIKGVRELNTKDSIKDLGPRTKIPQTLKEFIDKTCLAYIRENSEIA